MTIRHRAIRSILASSGLLCAGLGVTRSAHATWEHRHPHSGLKETSAWTSAMQSLASRNIHVEEMSAMATGDWIIVAKNGTEIHKSAGISSLLVSKVQTYASMGRSVDAIAFAPNGSWVIVAEDLRYYSSGIPNYTDIKAKVEEDINSRGGVRDLVIGNSGWMVVAKDNTFYSRNMGSLYDAAVDARKAGRQIREIELTSDGRWVLATDNWYASKNVFADLRDSLDVFQRNAWRLDQIMLVTGGSSGVYANSSHSVGASTIDQIEYTATGGNIFKLMNDAHVPGVSLALLEGNTVTAIRAYGEAVGGTGQAALTTTRFLTASLSKPVVRSGMRALANMTSGGAPLLDLDDDILDIRNAHPGGQLDTWMTAVEGNPTAYKVKAGYETFPTGVTVSKIMSMDAGFPYTSAPVFIIPSTDCATNIEAHLWLRGYECRNAVPNGWPAIWPDGSAAGTYSSPSYTVLLAVAQDVYPGTGNFADVFRVVLFDPAGMTRTTFDIDEINADTNVAFVHKDTGEPAPDTAIRTAIAGGGLYSTARDLVNYLNYLDSGVLGPTSGVNIATGSTSGNGYKNYSKWRVNWGKGDAIVVITNGAGSSVAAALIDRFVQLHL